MSLTRRLILQKARHHPTTKSKALTDCKRTVSGTLALPSRGTFHHSLTVLIRYRSLRSIQAYRVVPADSQQIPRARCYSGTPLKADIGFSRTGLSPSTAGHPKPLPLTTTFSHYPPGRQTWTSGSHNPAHTTPTRYHMHTV